MEFVADTLYIREMPFTKAGDTVEGHTHNFAHMTYVARGALRIEILDDAGDVVRSVDKRASDGYNWVRITADKCHRITAIEDNSLGHCIYSHRNPQGEVVQEYDGWGPAYV